MATTPHPTPPAPKPPTPPPPPAAAQPRVDKVKDKVEDKEFEGRDREKFPFDDPNQKTVQEEQLERSAEIASMGVEKWMAEHDERRGEDRPKSVAGVSPTVVDQSSKK